MESNYKMNSKNEKVSEISSNLLLRFRFIFLLSQSPRFPPKPPSSIEQENKNIFALKSESFLVSITKTLTPKNSKSNKDF